MTKLEIRDWINSAERVDEINRVWSDGHYWTEIYKKGDKYYSVDFYNFHPIEKLQPHDKRGSGEYEVKEVKRKVRVVEEVYYEEVEGVKDED